VQLKIEGVIGCYAERPHSEKFSVQTNFPLAILLFNEYAVNSPFDNSH